MHEGLSLEGIELFELREQVVLSDRSLREGRHRRWVRRLIPLAEIAHRGHCSETWGWRARGTERVGEMKTVFAHDGLDQGERLES